MSHWRCISNCGACCNLDPSDRPDLDNYLTPEELTVYLSMVGDDGWCINFNHDLRKCDIYEDRPRFCRVQHDTFGSMYNVPEEDFEEFAIDCCHQQIEVIYGEESPEMISYQEQVG